MLHATVKRTFAAGTTAWSNVPLQARGATSVWKRLDVLMNVINVQSFIEAIDAAGEEASFQIVGVKLYISILANNG